MSRDPHISIRSIKKLGSKFLSTEDVPYRIQRANHAFHQLWRLWKSRIRVSLELRMRMYNAFIKPILLYNAGSLDLSIKQTNAFDVLHRKHLRIILGIFYPKTITNVELYEQCKVSPISAYIIQSRWQLFGHTLRMSRSTPAQKVMKIYFQTHDEFAQTKKKQQKAHNLLPQLLHNDLRSSFLKAPLQSYEDLKKLREYAKDRQQWQWLVADIFSSATEQILATLLTLLGKRRSTHQKPNAAETPSLLESTTNQDAFLPNADKDSDIHN